MRRILPIALIVIAATGCGDAPAAKATPQALAKSADPINVAACQQYAKAADPLKEMAELIGPGNANGSMLITFSAKSSLEYMDAGASLARGDVQEAMKRSVAAVRIIQSGAATSPDGTVSMANEIQAVRLTVAEAVRVCKASGADIAINI